MKYEVPTFGRRSPRHIQNSPHTRAQSCLKLARRFSGLIGDLRVAVNFYLTKTQNPEYGEMSVLNHSDDNDKALTLRDGKTEKHATDVAETLIRSTGERVTTARVRVLGTLLAAGHAMTHLAVQERVASEMPVDRVTIYRVLRWLVSQRLANATIGRDRVWRFHIPAQHDGENSAHFECDECGAIHGLNVHIPREAFRVPEGYIAHAVELIVRGQCAGCKNGTLP